MTDIVYVLWSKSLHNNAEIRYSIRSAWRYGKNLGRLCIVGMSVKFLRGYMKIPYKPSYLCKDVDVFGGILRACDNPAISDPFLFFNDDYFMLKDFDADTVPGWHSSLITRPRRFLYVRTVKMLHARGIKYPKFFDIHVPILIHKDRMKKCCPKSWEKKRFLSKSLYANQCPELNLEEREDCKIKGFADLDTPRTESMFSAPSHVGPDVWKYLDKRFSEPSPFERDSL